MKKKKEKKKRENNSKGKQLTPKDTSSVKLMKNSAETAWFVK